MLQITVRGRDDAHVDRDRPAVTHPFDDALLQHAQQLDLHHGRHIADLVQEEGAAAGLLEASAPVADRSGVGPAHVSEELALEQVLRQRRAVDLHEGTGRPSAGLVHRTGHEFLAGAAFAPDQDGRLAAGHAGDQVVELPHLLGPADDPAQRVPRVLLLQQGRHLGHVAKDQPDAQIRSVPVSERHRTQHDVPFAPVGQVHGGLEVEHGLARAQRLGQHIVRTGRVAEELAHRHSDQIRFIASQDHLGGRVQRHDAKLRIQRQQALVQGGDDRQDAR